MKKKLGSVVFVGCLLLVGTIGIAGVSALDMEMEAEEAEEPLIPIVLTYHADAGKPYSGGADEDIQFDGSGTYISCGGGATYEWDFGDETTGSGKYTTHSYSEPGVYYVTLTATNSNGDVYKDIAPVYIDRTGDHLVPYGGCHYYADVDETIEFDGSQSVSNGADIVEWFWDFCDGTTAYGEQVNHSYDEERVYLVTLDVKDSNGFTRHDVLHADIGRSFSDEWDLFPGTLSEEMQTILEYLLDSPDFTAPFFYNLLGAKIYTKYNDEDPKYTSLPGLFETYREIDVNDDGDKDIRVNKPKFFKAKWAHSMFDEHSRVWLQFETTLSSIKKVPGGDIKAEDDFTICLQFDFDFIADKLDLDDTIMRVGYNSPPDQEMPNEISLVHILRPYLLFRMLGIDDSPAQGVDTDVFYAQSYSQTTGASGTTGGQSSSTGASGTTGGQSSNTGGGATGSQSTSGSGSTSPSGSGDFGEPEELEGEAQAVVGGSQQPYGSDGSGGSGGGYWPEYGMRISSSGGGSFSLLTMFLNDQDSPTSTTTVKITYGSSTSTMMYKRTKTGGLLNHAAIFEIFGDEPVVLSVLREKNGDVTELSTGFSFSGKLVRGVGWGDEGVYLGILGDTEVGLYGFYFDNPDCTLTFGEILLSTSGSFNLNFNKNIGKLSLDGDAGFSLTDLLFDSKKSDFEGEINGTLNLNLANSVNVNLSQGELSIGFEGQIWLSSDCKFRVDEETVTVGGNFSLESDGDITFTWGGNEFNIDLDAGVLLEIEDLNFEVGELIANASKIEIGASGEFDIEWDTANSEVTISGGSGVTLGIENVDITYSTSLYVRIFGSVDIQAGGWVTFGPDIFKAGFEGILDLGTSGAYVEFEINGENIKVGGLFSFTTGGGEIAFSWDNNEFTLEISYGSELAVEDLYFEVGDLKVDADEISLGASGDFSLDWNTATSEITISSDSGVSFGVENLNMRYGTIIEVSIVGSLDIQADGYITFAPGEFEAGFTGSLNLGTGGNYCQFIINGDTIKAGGLFSLSGGFGEISFSWANGEFSLAVSGSPSLTVEDLYFEAEISGETLLITADEIGIGANGDFSLDWDTANSEITISSNAGVSLSIENFDIFYGSSLEISIVGYLEVQADGYLTLAPGVFEAGFSGSLNLGTGGDYCEFVINAQSIKVGGDFTLSTGDGVISFDWSNDDVSLYVTGAPSLSVVDLYFEAGDLKVTGASISIGASGEFNVDLDTTNNEITISGGTGVSLSIENLDITYGTTLDVSIISSFNLQADGWLTFGSGVFEAGFTGTLDLGASCEFEINGDSITVGGLFALSSGDGEISFSWADGEFSLYVSGGPTLTVEGLYFEAEISSETMLITAEEISIGASGDFSLDWNTGNNEITISSEAGVFLIVTDVDFSYGTTLDIGLIGTLGIQADGYVTISPGSIEAGISGALDFGREGEYVEFDINGDNVKIGGEFTTSDGTGDVTITWSNNEFLCDVSGNIAVSLRDLYFEINPLKINAYSLDLGFNADLTITLDKTNKKFEINGDVTFGFDDLLVYTKENNNWHQLCSVHKFDINAGGYLLVESGTQIELDFSGGPFGQLDLEYLHITPPSSWNSELHIASASLLGNAYIHIEKILGSPTFIINSVGGSVFGQITFFNVDIQLGSDNLEISFNDFSFNGDVSISMDDYIQLNAEGSISLTNFNGVYGSIDVTVNMDLVGNGDIITKWISNPNSLEIDADVDFTWDILIETQNFGDWEAHGDLVGDVEIDAEWESGSGSVDVVINEQGSFNLLEIIHGDLTLNLLDISLSTGTITFEWERGTTSGELHVNNNGVEGSLTLFKLTWGTKIFKVEGLGLESGEFKFTWDTTNNEVTVKNGILNLGPTLSYEDGDLKISLSFLEMTSNYQQVITLRWYEDAQGNIYGGYIDTDDQELAEFVEFEVTSGSKGVSIALYGLRATDFSIQRLSGEWHYSGTIQIANRLTVGLMWSYEWHELDFQWDLLSQTKYIQYTCNSDEDITFHLASFELLGWDFDIDLELYAGTYLWAEFNFAVTDNTGHIRLDTGNQWVGAITFKVTQGTNYGIEITFQGLKAGEYNGELPLLYWTKNPWGVGKNTAWNNMQWINLIVKTKIDGTWKQVWPII